MFPLEQFPVGEKKPAPTRIRRMQEEMVLSGFSKELNSRFHNMKCIVMITCLLIVILFISVVGSSALIYTKIEIYTQTHPTTTESSWYSTVTDITWWIDCAHNYTHEEWYTVHQSPTDIAYTCGALQPYRIVRVQRLQYGGSSFHCDTQAECLPLITSYLDILEGYSKYSFFIDNSSNVYGGRGWNCPYLSGQLWLAVLSQDFGPHTQPSERRRILHHVTEDLFSSARCAGYLAEDLTIKFVD